MKICYLSDASNYHTKKWCGFFAKRGHEIVVISLRKDSIPGVKVYAFDETELRQRSDASKLSYLKNVSHIKKILDREQPDILHAHFATSYGLLGALTKYHPFIISVWGTDVYKFPNKSFLHRKLLEYNLKKADRIFSTSRDMARVTKQYTSKDVTVTPFGIDLNFFKPGSLNEKEFTVGIVKGLEKIYGVDYLIRGFKIFKEAHPEVRPRLLIAGDGSQRQALEQLALDCDLEKNCCFLGFLKGEEVVEAYRAMDVSVLSSLPDSESFGVSALEAQACQIPVIASRVGGLPEVVDEGKTGLLIEPENPQAIAEVLEFMYEDKNRREEMGRAGRKFVEEHYDIEDNFGQVEKIYQLLVKEKSE